ncbi:prepilin-type N-terminal cleavage/methylation domain-containing protein [Paenibacillus sp. F411]|uniref:Prepilin-type N-terminal cleavage/methylation domain-containing protein n=1 Tax=Paenibacillus algicola TaxID=2565926 RepID=A0A4P8XUN9_9BACL|nr:MULTISPECIES: prepilin-type N-terminal cleavage/methylation domain-containing protein [Paenibacillus]MBO2944821.1 prepilin-type N-terminal cleavage/methylation domain-containing protein [Paenibacillus sp. F411]QCT04539.1 hypothetical protein E6C60_3834 [Paenibacillus algicola]
MRKFVDLWRRQHGFTVIELIAAIAVFSLVAGLISTVTIMGFNQYNRISLENSLREEGDIIMSAVMTELYTFAPDTIVDIQDRSGILLQKGEGSTLQQRRIEIAGGSLSIGQVDPLSVSDAANPYDIQADLSGSVIEATSADGRICGTEATCASGLINIRLNLSRTVKGDEGGLELESKFGF